MKPGSLTFKVMVVAVSLLAVVFYTTFAGYPQMLQAQSPATPAGQSITRMGAVNTQPFDARWLFSRFGLQADGTSVAEPAGLESPDINDADWRKLDLPHDWAVEGPFRIELVGETGKLPYKGIGWYRKHFNVPVEDAGKQVFIDFDGAMAYAKVWLNGNYVGTWPYGYSSFRMDLTPYLKFGGTNVLAVRLDTEKWESRWYPGAGIYRHVWLVKTSKVHVGHWGTYITTPEISAESALIKMDVTIDNQINVPVEATIRTNIYELDIDNKLGAKVASFNESTIKAVSFADSLPECFVGGQFPRWLIFVFYEPILQSIGRWYSGDAQKPHTFKKCSLIH